ncbi:hypothetical protein IWW38_001539 [Coemansia aciculifera]|uniref:Uncharacterized protein n=1 Tax=Coemansia aciculifera TaxID=417176 RepID=A0ACC1M6X2_9FUNG|nr:hypothetical protein IWW38_001539 [Coemansia aciculifera]
MSSIEHIKFSMITERPNDDEKDYNKFVTETKSINFVESDTLLDLLESANMETKWP